MAMTVAQEAQREYSTAISVGAGITKEPRRLLELWCAHEPLVDPTRQLQAEGPLGNSTVRREIVNSPLSDEELTTPVWDFREVGAMHSSLCHISDSRLFGILASDVVEKLKGTAKHRWEIIQRAGLDVHVTCNATSVEVLIDVFAR